MKKIKRTITIRKVEFFSNKEHNHQSNIEVCPLCHSPIHVLTPATDSALEISRADVPHQLIGETEIEGEKND